MDQQQVSRQSSDFNKAMNIAYIALFMSILSFGFSGCMLYKEFNKPKTTNENVDAFFQQQDQEFDKMFSERKNNDN